MSNNKSIINVEIPTSVDNTITNLTDKPTKNIGSTLADIWFLVFGGIGQMAEKRKLRYAVELEKYNKELNKKLSEIPLDKRVEPDTQVIAPALEASKYCAEKEVLRKVFVNLIASSMNSDKSKKVHPIFTDIIVTLLENQTSSLIKISHSCVVLLTIRQYAFVVLLAMKNYYSVPFV